MSRIALLDANTLLGKEVRETLERQPGPPHDLTLLTTEDEEVGAVAEAYGGAALVVKADAESLSGMDLVFVCGPVGGARALLAGCSPATTLMVLSPEATPADGRAVVAGLNGQTAAPGERLRSPHPAAVALAHLVAPLVPLGLEAVTGTLVQPVSHYGQGALEELFAQTRNLIAMTGSVPSRFDRQLAFNLYPAPDVPPGSLASVLRELGLPATFTVAADVLQGGVFHGVSADLHLRFRTAAVTASEIEAALAGSGRAEIDRDGEDRPGMPGPVEVANEERLIVGGVRPEPAVPGTFWLWAVMDNLTRGGALNAVEVAIPLLALPRA